jgi:hypothetical protein
MEYIVEHKVKGQTIDIEVPQQFHVCVWGYTHRVEVKAEFSHEGKQHFAVIFKGKKLIWSAATLVSYYRMAILDYLLSVPPMPEEKCLVV